MTDLPRENVERYPRPPALEPVDRRILVRLGGAVVADSVHVLRVLETHHAPAYYIPPQDVAATLQRVAGETVCEWKGVARYFDVVAGTAVAKRAAWAYSRPTPAFAPLANHVAFYAGPMDECWVGDVRVVPQPGDFYGGWLTPNLEGRIKGAPGTRHW